MPPRGFKALFFLSSHSLSCWSDTSWSSGERGVLTLTPTVAFLLAIKAVPVLEFANLGSLTEAYEEPVIIPCLKGVQGVGQWHGVSLGHRLGWVSIQLSRTDGISVIPFLGRRMSVVMLRWFRWLARPR